MNGIDVSGVDAAVAAQRSRMEAANMTGDAALRLGGAVNAGAHELGDAEALAKLKRVVAAKNGNPDVVHDFQSAKDELLRLHSMEQAGAAVGALAGPETNPPSTQFAGGAAPLPAPTATPPVPGAAAASMIPGVGDVPGMTSETAPAPDPFGAGAADASTKATPQAAYSAAVSPTPGATNAPSVDPRAAYFRRLAKVAGLDMEGLGMGMNLATHYFGAPPAPVDASEVELRRAQAARAKREAERPFDIDPLSPEGVDAQRRVAEVTHPPKEPPHVETPEEAADKAYRKRAAELKADKEAGAGDFKPQTPHNIDPLSPEGIDAQLKLAERKAAAKGPLAWDGSKAAQAALIREDIGRKEAHLAKLTDPVLADPNDATAKATADALKKEITTLYERHAALTGETPATPPEAGTGTGVDPAAKAKFDAMTDAQRADFLSKANPAQKAKVGAK